MGPNWDVKPEGPTTERSQQPRTVVVFRITVRSLIPNSDICQALTPHTGITVSSGQERVMNLNLGLEERLSPGLPESTVCSCASHTVGSGWLLPDVAY